MVGKQWWENTSQKQIMHRLSRPTIPKNLCVEVSYHPTASCLAEEPSLPSMPMLCMLPPCPMSHVAPFSVTRARAVLSALSSSWPGCLQTTVLPALLDARSVRMRAALSFLVAPRQKDPDCKSICQSKSECFLQLRDWVLVEVQAPRPQIPRKITVGM